MARCFEIKCPCCGTLVGVIERPMGVPGGKDREEAVCPLCKEVVYEGMTDGWFDTGVASIKDTIEPYKGKYLSQIRLNQ